MKTHFETNYELEDSMSGEFGHVYVVFDTTYHININIMYYTIAPLQSV